MSFAPRFSLTGPIAAALARIERARTAVDAARVSPEWLASARARAFRVEAHHATHVDGTRLTFEQAEQILTGKTVPAAAPDDARRLLNYRDAAEFAGGCLDDRGPVGEGLIRDVHKRLVDGLGDAAAPGEYRSADGYVVKVGTRHVVYRPPPAADIPALVGELVAWWNDQRDGHPVIAAGIGEFQLAHIQPFAGGNGRTARLLSRLALGRAGYDGRQLIALSRYCDEHRSDFYRARQGVRYASMDLTGWLAFFTEGLATELDAAQSEVEREIRRDVVARHGLTERQATAVGRVLDEGRLTIGDFERLCPGAPRRALQRELRELVDRSLLRRVGPANRPQYLAGAELA